LKNRSSALPPVPASISLGNYHPQIARANI